MTDRDLLEMAAKACGIMGEYRDGLGICPPELHQLHKFWWNPLNDDGDALRLAIKLGVDLRIPCSPNQVFVQVGERGQVPFVLERIDGNLISATRRAIVRAAAEIGKEME